MDIIDEIKDLKIHGIDGVEKMGLLQDLDELKKIEIAHHIINAATFLENENMFEISIPNSDIKFFVFVLPGIRRILNFLLQNDDKLLTVFDAKKFTLYLKDMMPNLEKMKFLTNLDYEVEFLKLICKNYVGILEKEYRQIT